MHALYERGVRRREQMASGRAQLVRDRLGTRD